MKTVLVLFYSHQGATAKMANLLARGIESVSNTQAKIRTVPEISATCEATTDRIPSSGFPYVELDDLRHCDALALGSPTRFGNMAAPLKYFLEKTSAEWL